jgi:hypothetical protein
MRRLVFAVLAIFLLTAAPADAKKRSGGGTYRPKTVHVKSYTTKKGVRVDSHKRSTPRK